MPSLALWAQTCIFGGPTGCWETCLHFSTWPPSPCFLSSHTDDLVSFLKLLYQFLCHVPPSTSTPNIQPCYLWTWTHPSAPVLATLSENLSLTAHPDPLPVSLKMYFHRPAFLSLEATSAMCDYTFNWRYLASDWASQEYSCLDEQLIP